MSGTRDNSGTLGKNRRKEKDSHPDIKGQATINGVAYWISGWQKQNENGTFYSLAFELKDDPRAAPKPSAAPADDEIPF